MQTLVLRPGGTGEQIDRCWPEANTSERDKEATLQQANLTAESPIMITCLQNTVRLSGMVPDVGSALLP
jgi:hypothetical protein